MTLTTPLQKLFEKAEKLSEFEYNGMFYCDDCEQYFYSVRQWKERLEFLGLPNPGFIWCTKPTEFRDWSVVSLLSDDIDELIEDGWDATTIRLPDAIAELQTAIDKFKNLLTKELKPIQPDRKRVVIVESDRHD